MPVPRCMNRRNQISHIKDHCLKSLQPLLVLIYMYLTGRVRYLPLEKKTYTQKKVFPKKNNFSIGCLEIPTENAVILKEFKIRYELNKTPMNLNFQILAFFWHLKVMVRTNELVYGHIKNKQDKCEPMLASITPALL